MSCFFNVLFIVSVWAFTLASPVAALDFFHDSFTSNSTSKCYSGLNLEWSARVGSSIYATPRIVDLAHDGRKEILIPTFSQFFEALSGVTGEDVPGFPFTHPRMKTYASPLPVDMNGDGQTEWLVAMYTGELVVFGGDGAVQGLIKVPPLAIKRNWVSKKINYQEAAVQRPSSPAKTKELLQDILRARKMQQWFLNSSAAPHRTYRPRRQNNFTVKVANWDVDEDDVNLNKIWGDDEYTEDTVGDALLQDQIGPSGHLSPEAQRSMDLLFHPELYQAYLMDPENEAFGGHYLRGFINTTVAADEIEVDPHLLSSPVITDVDGNGDLDVILHVSYYFDPAVYAKSGKKLPEDIDPDEYIATALTCINLVTGEVKWTRVLHLSTKSSLNTVYAVSTPLVINADEERELEIIVTSTSGTVFCFDGKGEPRDGWPVWIGPMTSSPVAEDVSGDGSLDICVGDLEGKVRCFNATGAVVWEQNVIGGIADRITFGDVDGDGKVDVVFGTTAGFVYALRGSDGKVLPNFPVITGGSIIAPVLLVNLNGLQMSKGMDIVVPSHNGNIYLINGETKCIEIIDIDEKSSTMILADDITGNGMLDLLVTTINGGVYVFETSTPFTPTNAWPSKTKGVNGCTASTNYVGVFIAAPYRVPREIQGDTFTTQVTIFDQRPAGTRRYTLDVYIGTRVHVFHKVFLTEGTHVIKVRAPPGRMYSSLNVVLTLPTGQVFTDSVSLGFNMHFMASIKYTFVIPFVAVSLALMLVHKRHEVVMPESMDYTF